MESAARDGVPPPPPSSFVGLLHSAVVVPSRQAVLDAATAFVAEGLAAGDLTVLATAPSTAEEIRRRFGPRGAELEDDGRIGLLGARAPDGVAATRRLAERASATGSGRVRILAEPQFAGTAEGCREGVRYEAASNDVLAAVPVTALCVYDRTAFPEVVLDAVSAVHPVLLSGGEHRPNPRFEDPRTYLRRLPVPREPVEERQPLFALDAGSRLPTMRHAVKAVLDERVADEEQRADLYLAISEVLANAFRHGGRPVSARLWGDDRRMVCTVTDGGHSFDDPLAGFAPAHGDDLTRGGMGLWLARKLWDSVDLTLGPHGLTVRLATDLH